MDEQSPVSCIGIVGSGTMGSGIAQVAAQAGLEVTLYDISEEMLARARLGIRSALSRLVEKGRLDRESASRAAERIATTEVLRDLGGCDFIIEAAPEALDIKQRLFHDLHNVTRSEAILATNTSTLSITEIAASTGRPSRVVGMHFFNPAPLMPLVEIIAGAATRDEVVQTATALALRMGKVPVQSRDTPGFIVNRIARPFHLEGLRLLAEGVADPATIDRLMREGGGFRMGPFELQDLIGIDINFAASRLVYEAYFHEPRFRPSLLQQRMVESGRLGRKAGRGWYTHDL